MRARLTEMDGGSELERVAALVRRRNEIDAEIGQITGRPVVSGHLGEWIASKVFDIELEHSAVSKAIDGVFSDGPLAGKTVNIKWYGKQESLLDLSDDPRLDYYLVMTGPKSALLSSRGGTRPLLITQVYLFDAAALLAALRERGVKIGVASSIRSMHWEAAEIFPRANEDVLPLTDEQREALALFGRA